MGYKQRERKRKKRAAARRDQEQAKTSGSSAAKHWLTPLTSTMCCAKCGTVLRKGRDAVYRHTPRETLCVRCADGKVRYRPSLRWEQERKAA